MKTRIQRRSSSGMTRRTLLATGAAATGWSLAPGVFAPAIEQAKPIRIGVLAPLSGVYASLGANKTNGINMFFGEKDMQWPAARSSLWSKMTKPSRRKACARRASSSSRITSMFCRA
jgi:hypothetical protein